MWRPEVTCGAGEAGLDYDGRSCAGGLLESWGRTGEEGPASGEEAALLRTVSNHLRRHCSEFDDPLPQEAKSSAEAFQGKPFKNISPTSLCVSLFRRCWIYMYLCNFFFPFSCAGVRPH